MRHNLLPMKLQFFADGGGEAPAGAPTGSQQTTDGGQAPAGTSQTSTAQQPQVDYEKIQKMLDGTLAAKEDTALKAYFKQQGLTQEEAESAMATFKEQKAKNQLDVGAVQSELAQTRQALATAVVENAATLEAMKLGIDAKSIPYVLKMADLSGVTDKDGKVNAEAITTALNKVLEDVPAFKPQTAGAATGFTATKVGASGDSGTQPQQTQTNQKPVATKRWNRFN